MDKEYPTLEYFTSNPKGHLLERHVRNNFPEFYSKLMEYPDDLKFTERIYWYFHNLTEKPKCPICGGAPKFISFNEGYLEYCSFKCSMQSSTRIDRIKTTMLEKYGVENASQSQEIKDKKKKTLQEHYGVDVPLQSDVIKQKHGETCLKIYGVKNASQSQKIKDKKKETLRKHYGVDSPLQSEIIKNNIKQTMMERYGVPNIFMSPEVKIKARQNLWNKVMQDHREVISIYSDNNITYYTCKCTHPECYKYLDCDKIYNIPSIAFNSRLQANVELCTHLLPIDNTHISGGTLETFVRNILDGYNMEYETNNRTILSGKEVDIYITTHKLAIECNGVYWHSLKEPSYHHNKWLDCKNKGVQLLTIWEDQIINKPGIVKNIILSCLGVYEHSIGARQCEFKTVTPGEASNFLLENHLQGPITGSERLGLYYMDTLVTLMVFGRKRTALGNKKHDSWELYRYCCKNGWNIKHGAERLFKHFVKEHPKVVIESFSSNDISMGALYEHLGFQKAGDQNYSYWYIDKDMQRHHRYTFRKDELVKNGADPNMTEFQITDSMGLMRIYDSGQQKWIYNA